MTGGGPAMIGGPRVSASGRRRPRHRDDRRAVAIGNRRRLHADDGHAAVGGRASTHARAPDGRRPCFPWSRYRRDSRRPGGALVAGVVITRAAREGTPALARGTAWTSAATAGPATPKWPRETATGGGVVCCDERRRLRPLASARTSIALLRDVPRRRRMPSTRTTVHPRPGTPARMSVRDAQVPTGLSFVPSGAPAHIAGRDGPLHPGRRPLFAGHPEPAAVRSDAPAPVVMRRIVPSAAVADEVPAVVTPAPASVIVRAPSGHHGRIPDVAVRREIAPRSALDRTTRCSR